MTDVLDRLSGGDDASSLDSTSPVASPVGPADATAASGGDPDTNTEADVPMSARAVVATFAALAGAVHLAMVPVHAGEWVPEGIAFALAAWIGLAAAALVLWRPTRAVLLGTAGAHALFIAAWAVTRTLGMPFGPNSGTQEAASLIDGVAVALEAGVIITALLWVARPGLRARRPAANWWAALVAVSALALTTAVIASPTATTHSHGAGGEHAAGAAGDHDAMDDRGATGATDDHSHGEPMPGMDHGHDEGDSHGAAATPADDKGLSLLGNGHQHGDGEVPLDTATRDELNRQLALTSMVAASYPTVAVAEKAGYRRAGPFSPGLGTHYIGNISMNTGGPMTDDDILRPVLIFNGHAPTSRLVGMMYLSSKVDGMPDGFAGPNDHWHHHTNVCTTVTTDGVDTPFGADREVTKAQCDAVNGQLTTNTPSMVHVWTVPGWDNPQGGIFAELNPRITCKDGTYYTIQPEQIGTNKTFCRDQAVIG